jgi:hypothetical protein
VRLLFGRRSLGTLLEWAGLALAVAGWFRLTPMLIGLAPELDIERIWELVAVAPGAAMFMVGYAVRSGAG